MHCEKCSISSVDCNHWADNGSCTFFGCYLKFYDWSTHSLNIVIGSLCMQLRCTQIATDDCEVLYKLETVWLRELADIVNSATSKFYTGACVTERNCKLKSLWKRDVLRWIVTSASNEILEEEGLLIMCPNFSSKRLVCPFDVLIWLKVEVKANSMCIMFYLFRLINLWYVSSWLKFSHPPTYLVSLLSTSIHPCLIQANISSYCFCWNHERWVPSWASLWEIYARCPTARWERTRYQRGGRCCVCWFSLQFMYSIRQIARCCQF